jgi:hypothetical protein
MRRGPMKNLACMFDNGACTVVYSCGGLNVAACIAATHVALEIAPSFGRMMYETHAELVPL